MLVHFFNCEFTTHAWDDLCFAFLAPLGDLGVDLTPELRLDLARVACEQREEALRATVDDVDFVQRHGVHDLAPFLDLAFGTLNEFRLRANLKKIKN